MHEAFLNFVWFINIFSIIFLRLANQQNNKSDQLY